MNSFASDLSYFISGAIMLGLSAIGFFFYRFWRKTRDPLFAAFSASFWVLAVERIVLLLTDPSHELRYYVYLIRLFAFLLIIFAIFQKNRPGKP
jgi:hypothetical protein